MGLKETVANLELSVQNVSKQLERQTEETTLTREQLANVTEQLKIANQDKEHNQETIRDLEQERIRFIAKLSENQDEIEKLKEQLRLLSHKHDQLTDNLDTKSSEYSSLEARLRETAKLLSDKTDDAETLSRQLNLEQRKNAELTHALSTAKEQIVALKLDIKTLSSQLETAASKLHSAEVTTRRLRSELLDLRSKLQSNLGRQSEISKELSRSKGQNRSLTSELEALKAHHNNLRERQKDLLLTLESRERENGMLRDDIRYLQKQNNRLIEDHTQLLDENDELRGELESQHSTVLRLTKESDKLRRIVHDKDLEIFDLKSLIDERSDQIQELERKCHALQEEFKEQLTQSVSVHDLAFLQGELAANKRILARTNDHVTDLKAENAQLRALLARGGSLPQETGMSRNQREKWRKIVSDESESEELDVSKVWNPSLQNRKTDPSSKKRTETEKDEYITVTKQHSLNLEESDNTTSEDSDYGIRGHDDDADRRRQGHDTRTGSHSSSRRLQSDLPVMDSYATKSSATIAYPRTIEDVRRDIDLEIGAENRHYTTRIIGTKPETAATPDTRYVRLESVHPAAPTNPARKLLDADLDKVTVYRRFTESSLSATAKAKIILSSMGIPPDKNKGFELPTELVINGRSDPNDLIFKEDGRNNNAVAIIQEMFRIYNECVAVEKEECDPSSEPPKLRN